jgi:hypothetical protein
MESTEHSYQLFERKIQKSIKGLMKKISAETEWLDQHCMESIYYSETLFDLSELVNLKERLEGIANDLAHENCAIEEYRGYSLQLLETDPNYVEQIRSRIEEMVEQMFE